VTGRLEPFATDATGAFWTVRDRMTAGHVAIMVDYLYGEAVTPELRAIAEEAGFAVEELQAWRDYMNERIPA